MAMFEGIDAGVERGNLSAKIRKHLFKQSDAFQQTLRAVLTRQQSQLSVIDLNARDAFQISGFDLPRLAHFGRRKTLCSNPITDAALVASDERCGLNGRNLYHGCLHLQNKIDIAIMECTTVGT